MIKQMNEKRKEKKNKLIAKELSIMIMFEKFIQ